MNKDQIAEIKQWDAEHVIYPWKTQGWYRPILMERAEGIYMYDAEGKRYIDFCSGLLNINIGHGNKHVPDAMTAQMDTLCYVASTFTTEPKARLLIEGPDPQALAHWSALICQAIRRQVGA